MAHPTWPFYPQACLHDAAYLLALAHQQQLQVNALGQIDGHSLSRLASGLILEGETRSPRAAGLCFLVGLLGHAGLIADVGGRLGLADAAHAWLAQPTHRQIDQLRQVWWFAPAINTCWLPPNRRQRPLDNHWQGLVRELTRRLAELPTGRWTPVAGLQADATLAAILQIPREGHRLPGVRQAMAQQDQAMLDFLLTIALPRLGLIESDGAGGGLVRPTAEGADWLRRALEHSRLLAHPPDGVSVEMAIPSPQLRFPSGDGPGVVVDPDVAVAPVAALYLAVHLHAPALCTFEVAHLAERLVPDPLAPTPTGEPSRYRITAATLQQAVAWGYPVADALFLLNRFAGDPLPPAVVNQLQRWREEMTVLYCEPGYRLTATSPAILDGLRQREPFRRRTTALAVAGGRSRGTGALHAAWVSRVDALDLFRYLRRVGYNLDLPPDPNDWPLQPRLREPLPLSQLLIALRTYQQLRRLVPGMALLELEDLERALTSSLLPEDLAGVERLVASHVTFIKHHLKRAQPAGPSAVAEETGTNDERAPVVADDLEERLKSAAQAGTTLDITYADTHGKVSHRRVRPLYLEERQGRRYLLAFCELRQQERHFRLDRIVRVD